MAEIDLTSKKGYLAEAVTQRCFAKKKHSEIFGKTLRKTPVRFFDRTSVINLATLTIMLNFVEIFSSFGA